MKRKFKTHYSLVAELIYGIREYSHCRVYVMQYGSRSAPQLVGVGLLRLE